MAVCLVLLLPFPASAHIGQKLYMVHALSDDDLSRLDLSDGTTGDWQQIVGEPSIWGDALEDFIFTYDPTDLDFRIWLAWHAASGRLYVAYEATDDRYVDRYYSTGVTGETIEWSGDSMSLMVDGDHSGGVYDGFSGRTPEEVEAANRQNQASAQMYNLTVGEFSGSHIRNSGFWLTSWYSDPPYADAHASLSGEDPVITVIEFYVTPFDDMVWNDPKGSVPSLLSAGRIIGLNVGVVDCDTPGSGILPWSDPSYTELTVSGSRTSYQDARGFVDALLLVPGASNSAVSDISWARIKAGMRIAP